MVVHKHIYKSIAPIFIGALVFCSNSACGQDYLYQTQNRSEQLTLNSSTLIFSNNQYKNNSDLKDISQVSFYDFSKKLHSRVSIRLKDWSFFNSCTSLKDGSYLLTGTYIDDMDLGYSRLYIVKMDSCFSIEWAKILETDEVDGYQVDFPISKMFVNDYCFYLYGSCTYRKNYFWSSNIQNMQTSAIWKFAFDGNLMSTTPLFTKYQNVSTSGQFDTIDFKYSIQFSSSIYPRNLDSGQNGYRSRPIFNLLDADLNIIKQQAYFHFSDTTATFQTHLRLNNEESLFGGLIYPRPHPYAIRSGIPFIAKVNTSTGELLCTKNFESYTEKRKDGYVSSFVKNKHGTVAIVTTLVNDQNGEIFDTSSISFVQLDTAFNEISTYEFRPIDKELAYVDHTMYNDSIMYLLASIATRPENGVVYRSESAIFKVNVNTFEVLDWDSVGTPMDSFCSSEVIYEDGDIDFEPFYINRNYVDSSLLSMAEIESKIISVYPNPAKNILKTKANLQGFDYRIINLLGAELVAGKFENEIDVSVLQVGLYVLELSDSQIIYRARFYKE